MLIDIIRKACRAGPAGRPGLQAEAPRASARLDPPGRPLSGSRPGTTPEKAYQDVRPGLRLTGLDDRRERTACWPVSGLAAQTDGSPSRPRCLPDRHRMVANMTGEEPVASKTSVAADTLQAPTLPHDRCGGSAGQNGRPDGPFSSCFPFNRAPENRWREHQRAHSSRKLKPDPAVGVCAHPCGNISAAGGRSPDSRHRPAQSASCLSRSCHRISASA